MKNTILNVNLKVFPIRGDLPAGQAGLERAYERRK
jgi:hypothetical protein